MGDLKMNNMVYQRRSCKTILYYENKDYLQIQSQKTPLKSV